MKGIVFRKDKALSDLDEQAKYIQRESAHAALRFLAPAETSFQLLAAMPELGQRQQFRRERLADLRAWQVRGFENFVIYYRIIEDGIEIVRVLHAARDAATIIEEDEG